ncbi:calcium:proton antiporter [Smaragdicoccus niigatensis]|uniref:calcium:proton antiporter n=1 Tax=Smaragdicoccus niigatensis TaxID=359359 RepID=UPI00037F359C
MEIMTGLATRYSPIVVPLVGLVALAGTWGRSLPMVGVVLIGLLLAATVLVAVHHAEVVAHRVGEPFGSLVLAVAVTVIEVALIISMMSSGKEGSATLARDTVFAAVMITCNGIAGLVLLLGAIRRKFAEFHAEGTGSELATVTTLATLCLVIPTFTTSEPGPQFSSVQLAFAGVASLTLYGCFVFTQTIRHRDYFLPPEGSAPEHAEAPSDRETLLSLGLLLAALVGVVGMAKLVSPAIESGVAAAGLHNSAVGVVIALLILLPETIAAARAARRNQIQVGLNLAFGSAMASIGLTIPAIAVASIWLSGPLELGLGPLHMVLLALTVAVGVLTVVPGRATLLQGVVHLLIFGSFVFLAVSP